MDQTVKLQWFLGQIDKHKAFQFYVYTEASQCIYVHISSQSAKSSNMIEKSVIEPLKQERIYNLELRAVVIGAHLLV